MKDEDAILRQLAQELAKLGVQFAPLQMRKGTLISIQDGTPPSLTVNINGTNVAGVRYKKSYHPVVGDVVLMFKQGGEYVVDDALASDYPANAHVGDIEIDGALNHDGSTVGFFGKVPASQQALPAELTGADDITVIRARVNGITHVYMQNYGLLG